MPPTPNKIQAKYIPTEALLGLIAHLEHIPRVIGVPVSYRNPVEVFRSQNVVITDIYSIWSTIPPKVINAKLNNLMRKGLIHGCTCGCRGDFTLEDKGREYLESIESVA